MKLLLVNPPAMTLSAPLGLASLAAYSRRFRETRLVCLYRHFEPPGSDRLPFRYRSTYFGEPIDIEFFPMNLIHRAIVDDGFEAIGFTAMTYQAEMMYRLGAHLKQLYPHVTTIMGGVHATFLAEECLRSGGIDYVIRGEGEAALETLLERLEQGGDAYLDTPNLSYLDGSGRLVQNPAGPLLDIDELPRPARDLIPIPQGRGPRYRALAARRLRFQMSFSRGCPANCVFCASPNIYGRFVRIRKLPDIVAEIEEVKERYGNHCFCFEDDVFLASRRHLKEFQERIRPLGVEWTCQLRADAVDENLLKVFRRSGCRTVGYGIESGSQRILDLDQKRIRLDQVRRAFDLHWKLGLSTAALVIVGHPHERPEDLEATYRLLEDIRPAHVVAQLMTPYPGTRLHGELAETTGTVTSRHWLEYVAPREPIFIPHDLSRELMLEYAAKIIALNTGLRANRARLHYFTRSLLRGPRRVEKLKDAVHEMLRLSRLDNQ